MKRNYNIDKFRGFTIISMVLFHLIYNINFYHQISWYDGTLLNRIWQFTIAGSFFIISGITSNFLSPEKNIKRGIFTSLIGFAITIATYLLAPEQFILWGVLNGLGISMIITGIFQKYLKDNFIIFFLILFVMTYNIPSGSLNSIEFFRRIYDKNLFILGFPSNNFNSSDYFPIIPWIFIYLAGFTLGKYLNNKNVLLNKGKDNFLAKIGKLAMPIYLSHQIILYPLVTLIFSLVK